MIRGLYTGASGMVAQMHRMDSISNNSISIGHMVYLEDKFFEYNQSNASDIYGDAFRSSKLKDRVTLRHFYNQLNYPSCLNLTADEATFFLKLHQSEWGITQSLVPGFTFKYPISSASYSFLVLKNFTSSPFFISPFRTRK